MFHKEPNQLLKNILIDRGIKQVQAALDLDIHYSRFNRILNGWEVPSDADERERIIDYVESLGCDPSELWSE